MKKEMYRFVLALAVGLLLHPCGAQAADEHAMDASQPMASESAPAAAAPSTNAADASMPVATDANAPATAATAELSAAQISQAVRAHIDEVVADEGAFTLEDEQTGKSRTLELVQLHDAMKMGNVSCVCADMKDTASGESLDVDFDVEQQNGEPLVTDTRIHNVNGAARYTYDANGKRTPVAGAATSTPAPAATSTN